MGSLARAPHVIIFPMPAQGHVNSAMDLARRLASFDVSITFTCTEACIASMQKRGFDAGGLPIHLHGLPDGLPPHEKSSSTANIADTVDQIDVLLRLTQTMGPALQNMLNQFKDEGRGAACVIYDFTLWWVGRLCKQLRLPSYVFQPFSSSFCLYASHMPSFASQGRLPLGPHTDLSDTTNVFKVPGLPDLHVSEVPDISWDPNPICSFEYAMQCALAWREASGMLLNSVYDWEKEAIDKLVEMAPEMDIKAVGPLLPLDFLMNEDKSTPAGRGELTAAARQCMEWLDEQPAASVLYVAFGTIACLPEEQMHELAMGLEACEQRFLWVVRIPESQQQQQDEQHRRRLLPKGFEHRLKGRGVVLWELAPQRQILAHPAVGAFLTHCGWNSTAESLCRGVPMLCWPVFGDQPMNAKWAEEVAHTGIAIKRIDSKGLIKRVEVERMARDILTTAAQLRASVARARDVACHAALNPSGSSLHNLHAFVQMLMRHSPC